MAIYQRGVLLHDPPPAFYIIDCNIAIILLLSFVKLNNSLSLSNHLQQTQLKPLGLMIGHATAYRHNQANHHTAPLPSLQGRNGYPHTCPTAPSSF
jgi:hypothetical protein